jgi:hypothetical protein
MPNVLVTVSANREVRANSKDPIVGDRTEIKWILTKRIMRRGLDHVAQVKDHCQTNANMPINLWADKTKESS